MGFYREEYASIKKKNENECVLLLVPWTACIYDPVFVGATAAFTGKVTAVNSGGWRLVHSHPRGPLENHLAKPQLNYGVCTREEDHSCYFVGGIDR
jgi:hypothetical protein